MLVTIFTVDSCIDGVSALVRFVGVSPSIKAVLPKCHRILSKGNAWPCPVSMIVFLISYHVLRLMI